MLSLLPKLIYESICDLTPEILLRHEIRVLLMDYDNTIAPYTKSAPSEEVLLWLDRVRKSGIILCVVSNSRKSRASDFCKKHKIECVTNARKPFQRGISCAKRRYQSHLGHIALVGDQIYTDVLGANLGGLISILIRPIHLHNFWLKLRHAAELPWIILRKRRGVA